MRVVVFDIWGDYAHFRKFFTTSSPLTFSFPPPPTIAGILGAIYGTSKITNQHLKIFGFDQCLMALRIIAPIKKVRMGLNLIDTKVGLQLKRHTQIRTEFVKNPHYRIYFHHKEPQVINHLIELLKNHQSVYTLALGLSELLANFQYIGTFEAEKLSPAEPLDIVTAIAENNLAELKIEPGKKYIKERLPIVMTPERVVEEYQEVIYETSGKPLKARVNTCWKLRSGEHITFFWS